MVGVAAALAWTWLWWRLMRGEAGPTGSGDVLTVVALTAAAPFGAVAGVALIVATTGQPWRTADVLAATVGGVGVLVVAVLLGT